MSGLYTRAPEAHRGSRGPSPHGPLKRLRRRPKGSTGGGGRTLAGPDTSGHVQPEPDAGPDERLPGQFVSDDLQTDTRRFLEEVKDVVRRRYEAGLGRDR